jgi:acetyl-CoA synthetase
LQRDAARFANLLTARGICPGDVVADILPRGTEMLTVVPGTWRAGAVYQPIVPLVGASAFEASSVGAAAFAARIHHTGKPVAKLVVTDMANRRTLGLVEFCPPVLVATRDAAVRPGDGDFFGELWTPSASFAPAHRDGDDPSILLTGGGDRPAAMPKPRSLATMPTSILIGLDPREAAIGWEVTDPAWSTSRYFPIIRPLLPRNAATGHASDNQESVMIVPLTRDERSRRAAIPRHREKARLVA